MLGWDRNPLRRRIGRVEAAMVGGLIAVFVISAPVLAAVAGHRVGSATLPGQGAEAAWRLMPATGPRRLAGWTRGWRVAEPRWTRKR